MLEECVIFTKPPDLDKTGRILSYLNYYLIPCADFINSEPKLIKPVPRKLLEQHYAHIKEKYPNIFEPMVNLFSQEGIVLTLYKGRNIIKPIRIIVGHTDPSKANPFTIRGYFSNDSLDIAFEQKRPVNNVIHASGSREDGKKESRIWAPSLKLNL